MSLDDLFGNAHTAYRFTDEPVTDEELHAIYDTIKWAPTSMNVSPLRIVAVRSDQARARLLPLVASFNTVKVESAPVTLIVAADTDFREHLPRLISYKPDAAQMFADDDARAQNAIFNTTIQIGYLILGIRAHGLDAGPMLGFNKAGVNAEFFPDGRHQSVVLINVGHVHPEGNAPRQGRLEATEAVTVL